MIGSLPDGTRGFDCNFALDAARARQFYDAGFRFVVRYVGRVQQKPNDLSVLETARLMRAGLSLMVVQHVKSAESWNPEGGELGTLYGRNAALLAEAAGYSYGATIWCDLEGVTTDTPTQTVVDYCNRWYDAVKAKGYEPGLYVGWHCGLSARDLYYKLRFARFWSAYNLNRAEYPAIRGVQMRQRECRPTDNSPVSPLSAIDVNVISADMLRSSPVLMLAPGDR
jgi:hypothetical protein